MSDGNLNAVNVRFDEEAQWLVLERGGLRIACNLGQAAAGCGSRLTGAQLLLASDDSIGLSGTNIKLGPDSVAVVSATVKMLQISAIILMRFHHYVGLVQILGEWFSSGEVYLTSSASADTHGENA